MHSRPLRGHCRAVDGRLVHLPPMSKSQAQLPLKRQTELHLFCKLAAKETPAPKLAAEGSPALLQ